MFAINQTIDAVQHAKKQFVQNCPIEKKAQEAIIDWIENQTQFTKKAVQACTEASTQYAKEAQDAMIALAGRVSQNLYQDFMTPTMRAWQRA